MQNNQMVVKKFEDRYEVTFWNLNNPIPMDEVIRQLDRLRSTHDSFAKIQMIPGINSTLFIISCKKPK